MKKSEMWSEYILLVLIIFKVEASLPGDVAPQTILVNNMVVPAVREDQTGKDVHFTAEYHYVDGDIVNVACVNLLYKDREPLTMEYEMAGTTSDKSVLKDISSSKIIGFIAKLHAGHNNSYMICTHTGPKDYTKVMIRFVMLTEPNIVSISINGMVLRPIPTTSANNYYQLKYLIDYNRQPTNMTCEVERTDVKLFVVHHEITETELIPMKKTELSFYLQPRFKKYVNCSADYVTGGLAELVDIMLTTDYFPIDLFSPVHMELPPSGTVMELYSHKDYKLSVILYELKQNETLHLTCGPLPFPWGIVHHRWAPAIYLQLDNTVTCESIGCNVSTTLQHVNREHVHPPIVCYLKEGHGPGLPSTTKDIVCKEIRVILLDRALAVTEPSSTTLSTTLTADISTNNTATEPPSSNTNNLAYGLIAAGITIAIIILVIVIKKQYCVRLNLPIPAPRIDPASVYYENLLSVFKPINEREAAALQETHSEEIHRGDSNNDNCNTNKDDNQYEECHDDDHLQNGEEHHESPVSMGLGEPDYTEIDYSRCKPKVTEAPPRTSYVYDEPYPH